MVQPGSSPVSFCMAHRHDSHAHAHMSPPTFPHLSPQVTFSDRLLSATIPLPIDSRVAFATYVPVNICRPHEALDHGRRQLISRNQPLSFHDSIFAHTHIDSESSALHAFVLSSVEAVDDCLQTLRGLSIDGLKGGYRTDLTVLPMEPWKSLSTYSSYISSLLLTTR